MINNNSTHIPVCSSYSYKSLNVNRNNYTIRYIPYLCMDETEKDVILNHMWPVTQKLPKTREGFIITFADKFSALNESFTYFTNNLHKKKSYKYAYVFLSLIVFRII